MAELYKIRSTVTGLYSTGGNVPRFTKVGKLWRAKNHLTCHLNQLDSQGKRIYKQNAAEIVTIEIKEVVTSTESVDDYIQKREQQRQEHEERMRLSREEQDKKKRLSLFKQLKKEFEP